MTPTQDDRKAGMIEAAYKAGYLWIGSDVACTITLTNAGRKVGELQALLDASLSARQQPEAGMEGHPDDLAVDMFAAKMKAKLARARDKGRGGWDDPAQCSPEKLSAMLHDHVAKRDPVDVANFAMMIEHYGAPVSPPGVRHARVKCDRPGCDWADGRAAATRLACRHRGRGGMSNPTIPVGMKPWAGGDSAPADWDGGPIMCRGADGHSGPHDRGPWYWKHDDQPSDIIAYTPALSTPTTADDGEEARDWLRFAFVTGFEQALFNSTLTADQFYDEWKHAGYPGERTDTPPAKGGR